MCIQKAPNQKTKMIDLVKNESAFKHRPVFTQMQDEKTWGLPVELNLDF